MAERVITWRRQWKLWNAVDREFGEDGKVRGLKETSGK